MSKGNVILVATLAVLAAGLISTGFAEGDKNHNQHQKRWAGERQTVEAGDRLRTRDQDRDRLHDGSCNPEGSQSRRCKGQGGGDRLRDGSCGD